MRPKAAKWLIIVLGGLNPVFGKHPEFGEFTLQRRAADPISVSYALEPGAGYSLGPDSGTGVRSRSVPNSPSPYVTPATYLQQLKGLHK